MTETKPGRAHLITGGFPPGSMAGHDHDYARLRLLELLAERDIAASVANDFADIERWLPVSQLLITYVAGPYPDAVQCRAIARWLEEGGHWLGLHGTSGGRAERVEGFRQRRTVKLDHHAILGSYFLTHPPICKIRVDVGGGSIHDAAAQRDHLGPGGPLKRAHPRRDGALGRILNVARPTPAPTWEPLAKLARGSALREAFFEQLRFALTPVTQAVALGP